MNVKGILDNVVHLSIGINDEDADMREKLLGYLNNAASEMYISVSSFDESLFQYQTIENFDESVEIVLPNALSAVKKVRNIDHEFTQVSYAALFEKKFMGRDENPIFCIDNTHKTNLWLYSNLQKPYNVFVSYLSVFKPFDFDTEESFIPFRPEFHTLLVYGALYYLYQDMDGFKSSVKEQICISEWKNGINEYLAFLINSSADFENAHPYTRV